VDNLLTTLPHSVYEDPVSHLETSLASIDRTNLDQNNSIKSSSLLRNLRPMPRLVPLPNPTLVLTVTLVVLTALSLRFLPLLPPSPPPLSPIPNSKLPLRASVSPASLQVRSASLQLPKVQTNWRIFSASSRRKRKRGSRESQLQDWGKQVMSSLFNFVHVSLPLSLSVSLVQLASLYSRLSILSFSQTTCICCQKYSIF